MARAQALIVEDNAALSDNLVEVLEDGLDDYEIAATVARSVADALDKTSADLDVALVDLHLPDGAGTSIIQELGQRAPFVQVVIITGDATVESAIGALEEGAFSYILKPFAPAALLDVTRRALERASLLREREQLTLELERSEAHHRSVVESVPAFVLGLDRFGRISLWNRRLEEATGLSRNQVLGRPAAEFVGPAEGEVRLPLRGGGHRMVRWERANVTSFDSEATAVYAVGVDVTEEREMQLRAMRAERLAAIGTLAAGLAHEVRNPLNSASLQLQVLERRLARGETKPTALEPVVTLVHDEIRRLANLVNEFLSFARPTPLDLKPTSLNSLIQGVLELIRPEMKAASIQAVVDLDPQVGEIEIDAERLRQVLLNIVRNAVEAMGDEGTLTIKTLGADDQGRVRVEIQDTGPGFKDDAPIFDAFYTTKEQGTGLGLAIAHRIVGEHGGTISVESAPGRTCFSILLPQLAARAPTQGVQPNRAHG